jgi:hypothetical protein
MNYDKEGSSDFIIPPDLSNQTLSNKLDELADRLSQSQDEGLPEVIAFMREASKRIRDVDEDIVDTHVMEEETQVAKENEEKTDLASSFNRSTTHAGYNVFQLVDCQIRRDDGVLHPFLPPVYGAGANSYKPMDRYVKRVADYEIDRKVERRELQLAQMQRVSSSPNLEDDPRNYRVGNSALVVADGRDGNTVVVFYGCISAEVAGSWQGGRTNIENSVWFEVNDSKVANELIGRLDLEAKAYDEGTANNYEVIKEAMSGVFPKTVMGAVETHMFHRQEISHVFDVRKK